MKATRDAVESDSEGRRAFQVGCQAAGDADASKSRGPRQGAKPVPRKQRDLLVQIDEGRPQLARVNDDRLAEFAARYLALYHACEPKLRLRLAGEYGLTLMQVRDRTHLARRRGYLSAGSRGRAGAEPGPRLIALGWKPPKPKPNEFGGDAARAETNP